MRVSPVNFTALIKLNVPYNKLHDSLEHSEEFGITSKEDLPNFRSIYCMVDPYDKNSSYIATGEELQKLAAANKEYLQAMDEIYIGNYIPYHCCNEEQGELAVIAGKQKNERIKDIILNAKEIYTASDIEYDKNGLIKNLDIKG